MQKLLFLISSKSRFHGDVAKSRLPLKAITRRGAYRYHSTARKSEVPVPLVALLGIPEDRNSSYLHGPAKAPDIIRKFFHEPAVNTFCELGHDVSKYLVDVGNIIPQSNMGDGFYESVRPAVQSMVNGRGLIPLIVGGDHSITFPVCRAINDVFNEPLTIVHFDAHPDLYESYDGNKNSHASPFARICETPDLCCRLIQLGIRTTNDHQKSQQRRFGIFSLDAKSFPAHGSDAEGYLKKLISNNAKVYISIDVDVLEPGLAPGVSHREPGGLTVRQVIDAIHTIPGDIIGADIVEYNPDRDVDFITGAVCAKLLKELTGKIVDCRLSRKDKI